MFAVTRIPSVSSVNVTCPRTFPFGAGLRTATAVGRTLPLGAPVSVPVRLSELLAQPAPNAIQLIMSEWTNSFIDISLPGETFAAGHNFLLPRILNDCRLRRKPPCPHKTLILNPAQAAANLRRYFKATSKSFGHGASIFVGALVVGCVTASVSACNASRPISGCSRRPPLSR